MAMKSICTKAFKNERWRSGNLTFWRWRYLCAMLHNCSYSPFQVLEARSRDTAHRVIAWPTSGDSRLVHRYNEQRLSSLPSTPSVCSLKSTTFSQHACQSHIHSAIHDGKVHTPHQRPKPQSPRHPRALHIRPHNTLLCHRCRPSAVRTPIRHSGRRPFERRGHHDQPHPRGAREI